MSNDAPTLPALGVAVEVAWDDGSARLAVESADPGEVVLFDVTGAMPDVAPDVAVELRWRGEHGIWKLPARTSLANDDPEVLAVRPTAPAACQQRREAFRVATLLPVAVTAAGRPLDAKLRNVSETGMRLYLGAGTNVGVGDDLEVAFTPEDTEIRCCAVVRNRHFDGDGLTVGVELLGLDESQAQSVRRRLLQEQIAQRRRARSDGDTDRRPTPVAARGAQRGGLLKRLLA